MTVILCGNCRARQHLNYNNKPADFTMEGRLKLAKQYAEICLWLDKQDINVFCCTISNFEEVYNWNRQAFSRYFQVFIDVPIELLKQRDPKGLYKRAEEGTEKNVVGLDLPFNKPSFSDMVIEINEDSPEPIVIAKSIMKVAGILG